MLFCSNCGHQLNDDAKFCQFCGTKVKPVNNDHTKRETVFEGNIHKCPNCGETVNSFSTKCPSCGHEFREMSASSSVKELADKLQQIEAERVPPKSVMVANNIIDPVDEKKITLIKSFPIPNSREDLFEFLILSSSNIAIESGTVSQDAVSDAWKAKFEQAYQKARISFQDDSDFIKFDEIYKSKKTEIENHQKNQNLTIMVSLGLLVLIAIIVFIVTAPYR